MALNFKSTALCYKHLESIGFRCGMVGHLIGGLIGRPVGCFGAVIRARPGALVTVLAFCATNAKASADIPVVGIWTLFISLGISW